MPIQTIDRGTAGIPSDRFKVGEAFDTCQANDEYLDSIKVGRVSLFSDLASTSIAAGKVVNVTEYNSGTGVGGGTFVAVSGVITADNVLTSQSATAGIYFKRINYSFINAYFAGMHESLADNGDAIARLNALGKDYIIPPGTFLTSTGIACTTSGQTVSGSGVTTVIKAKDGADMSSPLIYAGADYVKIKNLKIDGNASNQSAGFYGFLSYQCRGVVTEDLVITDSYSIAHGFNECADCFAIRCNISYSRSSQPGFFSNAGTGPWAVGGHKYIDCTSSYCDLDGMIVNAPNVKIVRGSYQYNGQNIPGGGALGAAGIYSDASVSNIECHEVDCSYNTEFGINLSGGDGFAVIGCTCNYNALSGIAFFNSESGKIANNTCLHNGTDPTVANPSVWGKAGIQFYACDNLTIIGNHANQGVSQEYGIQYMGSTVCTGVVITCNHVNGTTDADNIRPGGYYSADLHPTLRYWSQYHENGANPYSSAIIDPASIASGASLLISSAFTWQGAVFGDFVDVSAPYSLAGVEAFAYVASTNNIDLILRNSTGGAVDLASGTWLCRVRSKYAT